MSNKLKPIRIIILCLVLIPTILATFGYYYVLPRIIDFDKYKDQIRSILDRRILSSIELGKLDIRLTWNFRARVDTDRVILKKHDGTRFIEMGPSSLEVPLAGLLNKKVILRKIRVKTLYADINRDKNGKFDVSAIIAEVKNRKYRVMLKNTDVDVNTYEINFSDERVGKKCLFIGEKIRVNDYSPDKFLKTTAKGRVLMQDKPDTGFDIYFSSALPLSQSREIRLKGEAAGVELGEIAPYLGKSFSLRGRGDLKFDMEMRKNHVELADFRLSGENINISASGLLERREINLRLDFDNTEIQALARSFPQISRTKNRYVEKILEHGIEGVISGNIILKGHRKHPDMFGKLEYKDLSILKDAPGLPGSRGVLDFTGHKLIMDNKIYIDKEGFASVRGSVSPFRDKTLDINITSSDIDFKKAREVLYIAKDFFQFKLGPVDRMAFDGPGRVNLNIAGEFRDTRIHGNIEPKGLEVSYRGFAYSAHDTRGMLIFNEDRVYYDEITAISEGMQIHPSGYSTLKGYSDVIIHIPNLNLNRGLKFVRKSPLLKSAQEGLKDVLAASGIADGEIHLKGTEDELSASGELLFDNANILYRGFAAPFKNIKGTLKFRDEDVYFEKLSGNAYGNRAEATGFIKGNRDAGLKIASSSIKLDLARDFVIKSPLLKDAAEIFADYPGLKGKSGFDVILKGNLDADPFESLTLMNINGTFTHSQVKIPVSISGGVIKIRPDRVDFTNILGRSGGIDFRATGSVSDKPDFSLDIDKFNFAEFKPFTQMPLIPQNIRQALADFDNFHGIARVKIEARPEKWGFFIKPVNVSAFYKPYDSFILLNSGSAKIYSDSLDFNELKGVISQSSFVFDGYLDEQEGRGFDLSAGISINSSDIGKFRRYSKIPLIAGGIIPLSGSLKGSADNWKLRSRIELEKGTYFSYVTDIGLPRDNTRVITIDAEGNKNSLKLDRLGFDMEDKSLVNVYGAIDRINTSKPRFRDFIVKTDIGCARGVLRTDIRLNGYIVEPELYGSAVLEALNIPDYQARAKSINFGFDRKNINVRVSDLSIGESLLNINALMDTGFQPPMSVKDLNINARIINVDELFEIMAKGFAGEPGETPPVTVANGNLISQEVILRDLITTNVQAAFTFEPDWLLSVPKVSLNATTGTGQGSISYNIKTTELSSSFTVDNMRANAIATIFLNLPNEVFGEVDGTLKFSTKGKDSRELIANSNGQADFVITKGHFSRLGSLEYLLRAVNVLHSGIGGFNINNIIDLISPQRTGHFEKLQGSVYAGDGVLYTDEITSSGKNLSLFISGKVDMLTNDADIQVLGRLSKKISGMLGPVGSVSINQFIDYIPGLGFLPATPDRKGLIDLVPGLSRIPGLELADDSKYRRFAVRINGDLYDQSSVRSFRWIE